MRLIAMLLFSWSFLWAQQANDGDKKLSTVTFPSSFKIKIKDHFYAQILQAVHTVYIDTKLYLRPGNYKLKMGKISLYLKVPSRVEIDGKIYFRIHNKIAPDGTRWLEPQVNLYKFWLDQAITIKKSGLNIEVSQISSYEVGKLELKGKVFTAVAKFIMRMLLQPDQQKHRHSSHLLEQVFINTAQLRLQRNVNLPLELGELISDGEILVKGFSAYMEPGKFPQITIPQLKMRFSQYQLIRYIKEHLPDRLHLPEKVLTSRKRAREIRKLTLGAVRNIALKKSYIDNLHTLDLSFAENEIRIEAMPQIRLRLYTEQRRHRYVWMKKKRKFRILGHVFEMDVNAPVNIRSWKWQQNLAIKRKVALKGKIKALLVGGDSLVDKKLQITIECNHINLKGVANILETGIRPNSTSLRDFLKKQIYRKIEIPLFKKLSPKKRRQLEKIRTGNISFQVEGDDIVFLISARINN